MTVFKKLKTFVEKTMRMPHVYQPVMLMTLLKHQGKANVDQIASEFLIRDTSQLEYYTKITNTMPGRVLQKHGIVEKNGSDYSLIGFDRLNKDEIEEIMADCQSRLDHFLGQQQRSYEARQEGCRFCTMGDRRIVGENELAYAFRDRFPVTELHTLVIPKRHVPSYFDLQRPEIYACNQLLQSAKTEIESIDSTVSGFNVGVNVGEDAGQSVFHCHLHLIPRRHGDVGQAKGGIRGVIPEKQSY